MTTRIATLILSTVMALFVADVLAADQSSAKRLPVPEAAAREKALATVRDLFKADIDKAKTPEEQVAVLAKLAKTAAETKDDPVGRFVLWQYVVETATKQGDVKAAFAAFDEVARDYEVDELSAKSRTFATLAPKITVKNFAEALGLASGLVGRAVGADRYEIAKAIGEPLNGVAQKFGDAATKKDIAAQLAEVKRLEKAYTDVLAALKTLEANAADPAANLTAGKYQMDKGNWDAALSYLALSDDAQLKDIAAKELAQPKEIAERIALADEWWKLGEADKSRKDRLQAHAGELYAAALPDATGLTKTKLESRLAEAAKIPKSPLDMHFTPGAKQPGAKDAKNVTNTIGMKLNLIPAGEFVMGSPEAESKPTNAIAGSEQQHRVKITKPFYIGVYPVTRGQFGKFVSAVKYQTEPETDGHGAWGRDRGDRSLMGGMRPEFNWRNPGLIGNQQTDEHPVVSVTWNDAVAFCDWLSKTENKKYRLPTEAEWEYACRAGTKTAYNFGDALNGTQANCNGNSPFPGSVTPKGPFVQVTTKVGSYKPNAWGLFDMHGNAAQWCADWFDSKYYANSPLEDPSGPTNANPFAISRVVRGGGYCNPASDCRSAHRGGKPPKRGSDDTGFRVLLETADNTAAGAKSPAKDEAGDTTNPVKNPTTIPKAEVEGTLRFTKWDYPADEGGRSGYFQKEGDVWVEHKGTSVAGRFKETARTAEYVEMKSVALNIWVRITPTQYSWSNDQTHWNAPIAGAPANNK